MKSLVVLGAIAGAGLAQTAQFANTSFTGPFAIGHMVPLMWTTGNGLPLTLSIMNSTWNHVIFDGRSVLPTTYGWTIDAYPGFLPGSYQLAIEQLNGGNSKSPVFTIVGQNSERNSTVVIPDVATTTVTWLYWDHQCGCTKTKTATKPMNTGWIGTATTWWDNNCGCRKTAVAPISTLPASNNYTVPTGPPVTTTNLAQTMSPAPTTTRSATQSTFTGGAIKLESSALGIAIVAVALIFV